MSLFRSYVFARIFTILIALAILLMILGIMLLGRTATHAHDFMVWIGQTTQLQREGKVVTVPMIDAPRFNTFRKQWVCSLRTAPGTEFSYLRPTEPKAGQHELYFYEHPAVSGTVSAPLQARTTWGPTDLMLVEVPGLHPDWDETFAGVSRSTFLIEAAWLATFTTLSGALLWLMWFAATQNRRRRQRRGYRR